MVGLFFTPSPVMFRLCWSICCVTAASVCRPFGVQRAAEVAGALRKRLTRRMGDFIPERSRRKGGFYNGRCGAQPDRAPALGRL